MSVGADKRNGRDSSWTTTMSLGSRSQLSRRAICRILAAILLGVAVGSEMESPIQSWASTEAPADQSVPNKDRQGRLLSQIGERLFALRRDSTGPMSDEDWSERARVIQNSKPAEDLRADAERGLVGFMARGDMAWGGKLHAPGIRCLDGSWTKKFRVFVYWHGDKFSKPEWQALQAFEEYAKSYNKSLLASRFKVPKGCGSIK